MDNKTFNKYVFNASTFSKIGVALVVCALIFAFVLATVFVVNSSVCEAATDFKTVGKSAYLVDYATGTVLYSRKENERLPGYGTVGKFPSGTFCSSTT